MDVSAVHFQLFSRRRQAVWNGAVKVRRGPTLIKCTRLVADYNEAQEITRLVCSGNVEAEDGDRWARGEKADLDARTETLVVTGAPEARQGQTRMRGSKVTFHLDTDTLEVKDVTAVLEGKRR